MIDDIEIITAKDVKKLLKVSLPLVYRMAERGQLPCVRIPCLGKGNRKSLVRFKLADILSFIEENYS